MRKSKKTVSFDQLLSSGYQFPEHVSDPEQEYIQRNELPFTIAHIKAIILTLDEPDQSIFNDFIQGGMTQTEIGIKHKRSSVFVTRCIRKCRAKILFILKNEKLD